MFFRARTGANGDFDTTRSRPAKIDLGGESGTKTIVARKGNLRNRLQNRGLAATLVTNDYKLGQRVEELSKAEVLKLFNYFHPVRI